MKRITPLLSMLAMLALSGTSLSQEQSSPVPDDPWPEIPEQPGQPRTPADETAPQSHGPLGTHLELSVYREQARIDVYCNGTRPTAECADFATRILQALKDTRIILDPMAGSSSPGDAPPAPPPPPQEVPGQR